MMTRKFCINMIVEVDEVVLGREVTQDDVKNLVYDAINDVIPVRGFSYASNLVGIQFCPSRSHISMRGALSMALGTRAAGVRQHFYRDIPGLGNVAISRHAQERMDEAGISPKTFEDVLLFPDGDDVRDGVGRDAVLWRQRNGIRIVVIEHPEPFRGAKLVKTVYFVRANERGT